MLPRVHKHIAGGHQWLSWALGRERALRATGVLYGEHKYTMPDGTLVRVHMMGEDSHVWLTPLGGGTTSRGWLAIPFRHDYQFTPVGKIDLPVLEGLWPTEDSDDVAIDTVTGTTRGPLQRTYPGYPSWPGWKAIQYPPPGMPESEWPDPDWQFRDDARQRLPAGWGWYDSSDKYLNLLGERYGWSGDSPTAAKRDGPWISAGPGEPYWESALIWTDLVGWDGLTISGAGYRVTGRYEPGKALYQSGLPMDPSLGQGTITYRQGVTAQNSRLVNTPGLYFGCGENHKALHEAVAAARPARLNWIRTDRDKGIHSMLISPSVLAPAYVPREAPTHPFMYEYGSGGMQLFWTGEHLSSDTWVPEYHRNLPYRETHEIDTGEISAYNVYVSVPPPMEALYHRRWDHSQSFGYLVSGNTRLYQDPATPPGVNISFIESYDAWVKSSRSAGARLLDFEYVDSSQSVMHIVLFEYEMFDVALDDWVWSPGSSPCQELPDSNFEVGAGTGLCSMTTSHWREILGPRLWPIDGQFTRKIRVSKILTHKRELVTYTVNNEPRQRYVWGPAIATPAGHEFSLGDFLDIMTGKPGPVDARRGSYPDGIAIITDVESWRLPHPPSANYPVQVNAPFAAEHLAWAKSNQLVGDWGSVNTANQCFYFLANLAISLVGLS